MVLIGSKYAMPMIVLNLGGEMIYILNQRLQAQNIADDKSRKVLQDVVKAMFSETFLQELFKPQEIYSMAATKEIFEKLAHSSIMRLNQSSMDKLFDLMIMGFKYQLLNTNSPQQCQHLLLMHLESIKALLGKSAVADMAQAAIDQTIDSYSNFTIANWIQLRQALLRFVQGRKIKVSLFLQHRMQGLDGMLLLDIEGKLPKFTEVPGVISFYENGKKVASKTNDMALKEPMIQVSNDYLDAYSLIGSNMYVPDFSRTRKIATAPLSSTLTVMREREALSSDSSAKVRSMKSKSSAKMELNLLADLLGFGSEDKASVPFKVNLFPNLSEAKGKGGGRSNAQAEAYTYISIDIDGSADSKTVSDYLEKLDLDAMTADSKSTDDDLLSLMDASK